VYKRWLDPIRRHQALRFLLVGGYNTLVGIIAYPLLYLALPLMRPHYTALLVLCQVLCITNAYVSYKYWVFQRQGLSLSEYLRFTLFYNLVFVVNLLVLPLLVQLSQANPAKIQVLISSATALGSYAWHKWVSFRE
jgi:putative flippase GtrA